MTSQETNPAGQPADPPAVIPGTDDRRSYGRRVGDRFPVHSPNRAVELAKGITAMAGAAFAVVVLLMVAAWLCWSMFTS